MRSWWMSCPWLLMLSSARQPARRAAGDRLELMRWKSCRGEQLLCSGWSRLRARALLTLINPKQSLGSGTVRGAGVGCTRYNGHRPHACSSAPIH